MYRGSASSRNISQTDRSARAVHPLFIVWLVGIGTFQPTIVVLAAERYPAPTATRVVSVQGNVTWSLIDNATLQAAKLNDTLCVGDTVRVGAKSRAVLRDLYIDEQFYHSLRFRFGFDKHAQASAPYRAPFSGVASAYYSCNTDTVLRNLDSERSSRKKR